MRSLFCLSAVVGVLASSAGAAPATANLTIVVWPQGTSHGGEKSWTLRCAPTGGTLPHAAKACRKLGGLRAPFAPVPVAVACSLIYGGPEVALVRGTFRGHPVWTRFKRTDSCQTDRWNRVSFLFPVKSKL